MCICVSVIIIVRKNIVWRSEGKFSTSFSNFSSLPLNELAEFIWNYWFIIVEREVRFGSYEKKIGAAVMD